jgi:hypothetical protein
MCLILFGLIFVILVTVWVSWYVVAHVRLHQRPPMEQYDNDIVSVQRPETGGSGKVRSPGANIDGDGGKKDPIPFDVFDLKIVVFAVSVCDEYPKNRATQGVTGTEIHLPSIESGLDFRNRLTQERLYLSQLREAILATGKGTSFRNYVSAITLGKWRLSEQSIVHPNFVTVPCTKFKFYKAVTVFKDENECEYFNYNILANEQKRHYERLGKDVNVIMSVPKDPMEKAGSLEQVLSTLCGADGQSLFLNSETLPTDVHGNSKRVSVMYNMDHNIILHEIFHTYGLDHSCVSEDAFIKYAFMTLASGQSIADGDNAALMSTPLPETYLPHVLRLEMRDNFAKNGARRFFFESEYFYITWDPTCIMSYASANLLSAPQGVKLGIFSGITYTEKDTLYRIRSVCASSTDNHISMYLSLGVYYISWKMNTNEKRSLGLTRLLDPVLVGKVYVHKEIPQTNKPPMFALMDIVSMGWKYTMGNMQVTFVGTGKDANGPYAEILIE